MCRKIGNPFPFTNSSLIFSHHFPSPWCWIPRPLVESWDLMGGGWKNQWWKTPSPPKSSDKRRTPWPVPGVARPAHPRHWRPGRPVSHPFHGEKWGRKCHGETALLVHVWRKEQTFSGTPGFGCVSLFFNNKMVAATVQRNFNQICWQGLVQLLGCQRQIG